MDTAPSSITTTEWMTTEEAAQWLRVSKRTLERACRKHRLPALQVESTWRVSRTALIAYAKANVKQREGTLLENGEAQNSHVSSSESEAQA